jgi:hypothetical protein
MDLGQGYLFLKKDAKGNWQALQIWLPTINTKYAEEGVFLPPDGVLPCISAARDMDLWRCYEIFKSTLVDGKWMMSL